MKRLRAWLAKWFSRSEATPTEQTIRQLRESKARRDARLDALSQEVAIVTRQPYREGTDERHATR